MRIVHQIPICAICGVEVSYDPKLGDHDAGPVHITLGAYTLKLVDICADCMAGLFAWLRGPHRPAKYDGLLHGMEKLSRLPRA